MKIVSLNWNWNIKLQKSRNSK